MKMWKDTRQVLLHVATNKLLGVDYTLTFAAVMDLGIVKVILVLSRRWNVPAQHGDILSAYVKAEKEKDLDIYMNVPCGMQDAQDVLKQLGVDNAKRTALLLKSHFTVLSKLDDYGANCYIQS